LKTYLAGAIEYSPDKGKQWRRELADFLKIELNHDSYNPHIEEPKILTPAERVQFRAYKQSDIPVFQEIVRKLIRNDLHSIVNEIDYIVCLWDEYAEQGGGTYGELTLAFYHDIPVYMVTPKPLEQISGWILGCTTEFFKNFDELKVFLKDKYLSHDN
jgi:hypothetical protein